MYNPFSKIKTISELKPIIKKAKKNSKKIVLGHGVFDFLHYGHIYYLWQAKNKGDILIVSVLADKFVPKKGRPIFNEVTRAVFIASLECVDYVILCKEDGPYNIISDIKPDIYSKAEDCRRILKDPNSGFSKDKKILEAIGGTLFIAKELPMHSSDILDELAKKRGKTLSSVNLSIKSFKNRLKP